MIPLNENLFRLKPSAIRRFTAMAKDVPDCVMLTLGEPDLCTPQEVKDAAIAALKDDQTHYAPNQGTAALRQAIADYETRRGMVTSPDQVLATVGATEALSTAMEGILNPGDQVIVLTPAYPLYESLATLAGCKTVKIDISRDGFRLTRQALDAAITDKTRAIVLNSPNNPTGTVPDAESLRNLKDAILGKPIWLVCDNVYSQLSYGNVPDITLDPELAPQRILCQSFSKPYAMTGWRIGYLTAPLQVTEKLLLLHAARVSCLPTFVQSACLAALKWDTRETVELYRSRRDYVLARLEGMDLPCPRPEGAFYVFPDIRKYGMDSETFCTRMIREAAVAAVPGSCFGAEGFLRLSYCCSMERLKTGLDRMEQFLKTL
ncbi:MAG: pyridoxal phosphate-dependent aminotransferase [Firmicutes bacterium]|nr:pyridoxal phosphate-dependent aminotransferase [Bacillota bacterium]